MTFADFVSIYRDYAKPCSLLRLAAGWGEKPYYVCSGLLLVAGTEKERVESGIETSRTVATAYFATQEPRINPIVGDLLECLDGTCFRIEDVSSIDLHQQVFELKVMHFSNINRD